MSALKNTHWQQWDKQEERRLFVELNNTYLRIERGDEALTIHSGNRLRVLVGLLFDATDTMREWWMSEFQKLPNWFNV